MKDKFIVAVIVVGILTFAFVIYRMTKTDVEYSDRLKISKSWNLPYELREVSGISHIDDYRLACVQDEEGVIFIYDLKKDSVTQNIKFGPRGDYEAIRIKDSTAYILQSDGQIYEVIHFESDDRKVNRYQTKFSSFNDMESFDFIKGTNEFLTIPKENNLLENRDEFIIYKLSLNDFSLQDERFVALSYKDSVFKIDTNNWLRDQGFLASELTVHPHTQEIYILDSRIPKLMILSPDGTPKQLFLLNPEQFQQPEGLSFDSKGRLYISNEEKSFIKQNLHLVELRSN